MDLRITAPLASATSPSLSRKLGKLLGVQATTVC